MSIDKLNVKVATLGDHGEKLDTLLEASKQNLYRSEGEKQAYKKVLDRVQGLGAHVDKDLEDGKFAEFGDFAMPIAALIKRWILRAGGVVDNLNLQADANRLLAEGQVAGVQAALKLTQREYDVHFQKLKSYSEALDRGEDPEQAARSQVLSPAEDIAQRREEARKEKEAKAKAEAAVTAPPPKSSAKGSKAPPPSKKAKTGKRGKNT